MQKELERYLDDYNGRRPHMALEYRLCRAAQAASLGGLAPMEFLAPLKKGGSQSRMY